MTPIRSLDMYTTEKSTQSYERENRVCEEARDTHRDTMMNIEPLDHNLYFFANIWVLFLAETVPKVLKCTPPSLLLRYNSSPKSGELETYKGRNQIAMFAILPVLGGVRGGIWEKEKLPILLESLLCTSLSLCLYQFQSPDDISARVGDDDSRSLDEGISIVHESIDEPHIL